MRQISKPSTAKCNSTLYTLFLLAEPRYVSCVRLSEILSELSHDSVNRFLLRETYTPKDLFDEVKAHIVWTAGTLSVDDSVEDKPYRHPSKSAFVDYFWSGKHKRSVKGLNLITLYYTDTAGHSYPINFRIYDKQGCLLRKSRLYLGPSGTACILRFRYLGPHFSKEKSLRKQR